MLLNFVTEKFAKVIETFKEHSVDSVLRLVNFVPTLAGFSLHKEKITFFAPFWIVHSLLLFYVYGVGNLVYQVYYAHGTGDFIKSYVNISLLILIANNTWWFLAQWSVLRSILKEIKLNDDLAKELPETRKNHKKYLKIIKYIVLAFYSVNCTNAVFVYLPHRVNVNHEFSMTPCVGLEPLTSSPNREICLIILCAQELSIMTVVLNYQALLLFFIDHTAAMYLLLAEEILAFDKLEIENDCFNEKLPSIVERHALTLRIINKLKLLYSVPLGINFGSNAVCISLFFYLPLEEWPAFMPILVYCFLVFFLYCFLCQRLINAAEVFEKAVYGCGWEKYDERVQKTIYIMLLQAQGKVEILAADIIPVNIYTFATTCQFMFKFVTVMKF